MGGTSQYSMGFIRVVEDIISSVDCHDGSGMYLRYVRGYHYRCEGFYNSRVKTINTMEGNIMVESHHDQLDRLPDTITMVILGTLNGCHDIWVEGS